MKRLFFLLLSILTVFALTGISNGAVEWNLEKSLHVESAPRGITVSPDGKYTYVLTDDGTVLIYTSDGTLTDKINVGNSIADIEVSKDGSRLFLTNRAKKSIDIINISFIYDINTVGSPVKGPAFAPVSVVVFNDFQ